MLLLLLAIVIIIIILFSFRSQLLFYPLWKPPISLECSNRILSFNSIPLLCFLVGLHTEMANSVNYGTLLGLLLFIRA